MQILAESKDHNVRISRRAKDDSELGKIFLEKVNQKVNMELLTFRAPDMVYICTVSEYGLREFVSKWRAWTYLIPLRLKQKIVHCLKVTIQVHLDGWGD